MKLLKDFISDQASLRTVQRRVAELNEYYRTETTTKEGRYTYVLSEYEEALEAAIAGSPLPSVTPQALEAEIMPVEVVEAQHQSYSMEAGGLTRFEASTVNLDLSAAYQGLQQQRDYLGDANAQIQAAKEMMWAKEAEAEMVRKQQIQQEVRTRMEMAELQRQNAELMAQLGNVTGQA